MELMRHSTLDLTMKVYTDPTILPTQEAIAKLPGPGTSQKDGSM
jgi:hypothetical protein